MPIGGGYMTLCMVFSIVTAIIKSFGMILLFITDMRIMKSMAIGYVDDQLISWAEHEVVLTENLATKLINVKATHRKADKMTYVNFWFSMLAWFLFFSSAVISIISRGTLL